MNVARYHDLEFPFHCDTDMAVFCYCLMIERERERESLALIILGAGSGSYFEIVLCTSCAPKMHLNTFVELSIEY
jgi:hypothetical protein